MSTGAKTNLAVDANRIAGIVNGLAGITEPDRPYTRRAFTPLFLEGRAFLERRFRAAGLETRTIDMHVARLRAKLRDPSGRKCPESITTVRGQGYMAGPELVIEESS